MAPPSLTTQHAVAIVGRNGVGKSTLIKLLCGLYSPDTGTIRIDGLDTTEPAATRRRVAVIFTEFAQHHLTFGENIDLTHDPSADPPEVLTQAVRDAGAAEVLDSLPEGWSRVLSAKYRGGTDLSDCQWQRVALARALAAVSRYRPHRIRRTHRRGSRVISTP